MVSHPRGSDSTDARGCLLLLLPSGSHSSAVPGPWRVLTRVRVGLAIAALSLAGH